MDCVAGAGQRETLVVAVGVGGSADARARRPDRHATARGRWDGAAGREHSRRACSARGRNACAGPGGHVAARRADIT